METENGNKNGASPNGSVYRFDDFEIDAVNRTLMRRGETVALTGKVFDVLLVFVENPDRLLEKDELIEKVWHSDFVEEGNLARSVSSLRKALEEEPKAPKYIVTVQGRGYRFSPVVIPIDLDRTRKNLATTVEGLGADEPPNGHWSFTEKLKETVNRKHLVFGITALLLVALASGIGIFTSWRSVFRTQNSSIDSIAVLPFENATGDPELDYLSDGVAENVINALSSIANLRVLPRNTVFPYKMEGQDPYSVGTKLGVRSVLTGIIIRSNDTVTIQTELIDVDRKAQIWGQQYAYRSADISTIQSNIAVQVVNNLRLRPSSSQQQELTRRTTANPDAQKAYMWGLYYFNQGLSDPTQGAFDLRTESIAKLQEATRLDPNYAQAYADLARSYQSLSGFGENRQKAQDAAETALRLDETNPSAHSMLGVVLWQDDWDWVGAEREFRRAIEISPNEAHYDYAQLLSAECRHEEAISEIKIAEQLDPLNQQIKAHIGFIYKDAGQYDLAIDQFNSVLQMNPDLINARFGLIEAYTLNGKNEKAENESQNLLKASDRIDTPLFVGSMYAYMGRRDEASQIYEQYKNSKHPTDILMASIASSLGDNDAAFYWLEKAFSSHSRFLIGIKSSPIFDRLHDDARFAELLRRMGMPS